MRAEEILKKRMDRAIASILNVKEREVDPLLKQSPGGERASRLLRKVILDQMNDFCDMARDVAGSGEAATMEFNADLWAARIEGKLDEVLASGVLQSATGGGR